MDAAVKPVVVSFEINISNNDTTSHPPRSTVPYFTYATKQLGLRELRGKEYLQEMNDT